MADLNRGRFEKMDVMAMAACADESRFRRCLLDKLRRYGRAISTELRKQVRFIYDAFCSPSTPFPAKLMVAGALVYFILPADAIPDFLPALGFTDDAAVIGLALKKLREVVAAHRKKMRDEERWELMDEDLHSLRLDLALAEKEIARLRAEEAKWRRTARAEALISIALCGLVIWMALI